MTAVTTIPPSPSSSSSSSNHTATRTPSYAQLALIGIIKSLDLKVKRSAGTPWSTFLAPRLAIYCRDYPQIRDHVFHHTEFLPPDATWAERSAYVLSGVTGCLVCETCGSNIRVRSLQLMVSRFCSRQCSAKSNTTIKTRKSTVSSKYGVPNISQLETVKFSKLDTSRINYGVDNPNQSPIIRGKSIRTNNGRYGVDNPMQNLAVASRASDAKRLAHYSKILSCTEYTPLFAAVDYKGQNAIRGSSKPNYYPFRCNTCKTEFETYLNGGHLPRCPKCFTRWRSGEERELSDWVSTLVPTVCNSRKVLGGNKEIDIFIPELKIGIEYNGLYWHSDLFLENSYHSKKWKLAKEQGIHLIQVWSDDWKSRRAVVKHTLLHLLGKTNPEDKVYGRDTKFHIVSKIDNRVRAFYSKFHIQGPPNHGMTCYLTVGSSVVAAMTFSNVVSHRGTKKEEGHYELVRFATRRPVVGGASKLFVNFCKQFNPLRVVSYSHNDMFTGKVYELLGFTHTKTLNADYRPVIQGKRVHKSQTRHSNLGKILESYDPSLTELDNLKAHGIHRVFDSGKLKWEWVRTKFTS